MPNMFVWTDKKARGALTAKRTEALKVTPSPLELNVLANHVLNIESCPYFLFGILHTSSIAPFTSVSVYG